MVGGLAFNVELPVEKIKFVCQEYEESYSDQFKGGILGGGGGVKEQTIYELKCIINESL